MPKDKSSEDLKHEAEAEAALAAAEVSRAEAAKLRLEMERYELDLEDRRRKRAREDASDENHHVYTFNEPVSAGSSRKCIEQLATWMRTADDALRIEIVFNSPGGSVIDGMALWDYIKFVQSMGHHVTTTCIGMAASMAGILLQAGDVRVMGAESYLLIHEVSFGAGGKIGEVEDEVAFVRKIQERVVAIFASRSNLTKQQIRNRWRRKDWWLDSAEALKLGFVDEVR